MRAAARLLIAACLVSLCGGGAMARSMPEITLPMLAPTQPTPRIAALAPQHAISSSAREPFDLAISRSSPLAKRWRALQGVIRVEVQLLTLCRAKAVLCPASVARFLAIVEAGRARSGKARLGEINRAVNLAIRPMSDLVRFGVPDVWSSPLMTFSAGVGDCEDYAIAKFVALRQAGMGREDLRLVILHDRLNGEDHAVVAARLNGDWVILDNRTMLLTTDVHMRNVTPLLALDSGDEDSFPVIVAEPQRQPDGDVALASRK